MVQALEQRVHSTRFVVFTLLLEQAGKARRRAEFEKPGALLAEIYNWFTEGFDTADLKDAKALLDELRSL